VHRASAGEADLLIVEVQRGGPLSEDDIERLADDYRRGPELAEDVPADAPADRAW
jgi:hypothetical protein